MRNATGVKELFVSELIGQYSFSASTLQCFEKLGLTVHQRLDRTLERGHNNHTILNKAYTNYTLYDLMTGIFRSISSCAFYAVKISMKHMNWTMYTKW